MIVILESEEILGIIERAVASGAIPLPDMYKVVDISLDYNADINTVECRLEVQRDELIEA